VQHQYRFLETQCSSGFVDDVICAHDRLGKGHAHRAYAHSYSPGQHRGRSLMSAIRPTLLFNRRQQLGGPYVGPIVIYAWEIYGQPVQGSPGFAHEDHMGPFQWGLYGQPDTDPTWVGSKIYHAFLPRHETTATTTSALPYRICENFKDRLSWLELGVRSLDFVASCALVMYLLFVGMIRPEPSNTF